MKFVFISAPLFGALLTVASVGIGAGVSACGGSSASAGSGSPGADGSPDGGANDTDTGVTGGDVTGAASHASDVPVNGTSAADVIKFNDGDTLFDTPFREPDGLGPVFVRDACGACHDGAARGPGLVQKMAVVEADGITGAADQSILLYGHSIREGLAAGAKTPVTPPTAPTNGTSIKVSTRLGPPVLGRGYMEAVLDSEIERVAAEQATRTDGIHGVINRVTYASVANPDTSYNTFALNQTNLIGRFGVKARVASLDDFTADAFQGDMGVTSPMRPTELLNPDGLTDDDKPGVDATIDMVNGVAFYVRHIAIPPRVDLTDAGAALFAQAKCNVCHVPSMKTRADYPITQLAGIDAPIYTDLLLHDMGNALADGMTDGSSLSTQWRTSPLIGLRFSRTFLHDGRVTSIAAAIAAHDGEGKVSADLFNGLSAADQQALLAYVDAL